MLTLFTVKMKWHFEDPVIIKQFCAITQTEIDFFIVFSSLLGQ